VKRVLILGGTTEARQLAEVLVERADVHVVTSLAGRVRDPRHPPGELRIGGFGGVDGLARWIAEHHIDAVVDATHPFAARMTAHAVAAAAVPLIVVRRPDWEAVAGDRWVHVPDMENARRELVGDRIFLTTGRQSVAAFADCPQWFLVRSVDAPEAPLPRRIEVRLDRGPFTLDGERDLLRQYRIETLVTKNSGGAAAAPKLQAARELGLPVVMVDRPPLPPGVAAVASVPEALRWLDRQLAGG
jgi:precorrin-6A/cobalt-precorrin-6A reductase